MNQNALSLLQNNALVSADPAITAAAETSKQRIQAAYIMAIQKPRDIEQVRTNALKLCAIPKFAEQFISYKPIGKTRVSVDSIRAMEGLASVYGNLQTDSQVTYDDRLTHREKCFVTDLETNMTYSDEFTLSKTVERKVKVGRDVIGERVNTNGETVYIVVATEDEMLVKINATKSKTMRNLLHRVIQPWLIEECREKAIETMNNNVKDNPESAKRKIIDGFSALGVNPSDLAKYIGHPIANLTPAEIMDLRNIYSSVKNGEASFWEFLNAKEEETKEKKSKFDKEKELLNKKEAPAEEKAPAAAPKKSDFELLQEYIDKNGVPVSAEEIKAFVEGQGEIFSFDMIKPNINKIAETILTGVAK